MEIMTDNQLLEQIEHFIAQHDMAPSRFGLEAMGDGALVTQLRKRQRSLTLKNAEKVVDFMKSYRPPLSAATLGRSAQEAA